LTNIEKEIGHKKNWILNHTGVGTVEVQCDSWNGFLDFLHDEGTLKQSQGYFFRGHASETWKLEPTLKRGLSENNIKDIENKTLDVFKKHCLGRRGNNPSSLDESEWWALGQHFGLNTPLLDWSESPFVAAFFAFNSNKIETENVVVWMLSKTVNEVPCISNLRKDKHLEFLFPYLDENARLINQRGLFVKAPNMMCISEWIKEIKESSIVLLAKVLIPASEKSFALDSLDKMNINDFTLFPDLLGAGQYANYVASRPRKNMTKKF